MLNIIKKNVKKMEKVIIYSTHQCPFCIMAKKYMDTHKISYENHFVDDDEAQREEMVKKSGQLGVPVLEISGKLFTGFGEDTQRALNSLIKN